MAVLAALVMVPALAVLDSPKADADYATGGSGLYKGNIDWLTWGNSGDTIANNQTSTSTRTIAGKSLVTTCQLTSVTAGTLKPYSSGGWGGDMLDDLYNVGGTDKSNQLVSGLANAVDKATVDFHVSCSAAYGGSAIPLSGLVFADAEASNASQTEYVQAEPTQTGATWRVIERARTCSTGVSATFPTGAGETGRALRLAPTGDECSGGGPMAIGFMDGGTEADVKIKGGGTSAVALGVVLDTDFGDAPASYGQAGALVQRDWNGGAVGSGVADIFSSSFSLATPGQPSLRLGATTDAESAALTSAAADGDDTNGTDDEDAISAIGRVDTAPGKTYQLSNVQCNGTGYVAGWIDWNSNRVFDSGERSAPVSCTAPSVNLSWTVPSDVEATGSINTFLRLRIAATEAEVASPTGMTISGEVEDHPLQVRVPTLTIQKDVTRRAQSSDQFTLTARDSSSTSLGSAITTGAATGVQSAKVGPVVVKDGQSYSFSEAMASGSGSALSEYGSAYQCTATAADGTTTQLASASQASGTVQIPAITSGSSAAAVTCTFTNTPKISTLAVAKVWKVNGTTYQEGSQPDGLSAQLTEAVDGGAAQDQDWGATRTGLSSGQLVELDESTDIAESMPGCRLDSQQVTSVNGTTTSDDVPEQIRVKAGANTATVTNTVTCTTSLTLVKDVRGGAAEPGDWTLEALPGDGDAVVSGTSGVTSTGVTAGTRLQLAERDGDDRYVQDDRRTDAERTASPRSSGSWTCAAVDADGDAVDGVITARMGTDGTVTPALGSKITCTAVNRTATLTVLKSVENVNGTGTAEPGDWMLQAAASDAGDLDLPGLDVAGAGTASTANTFQVRPGQDYALSEHDGPGGYLQVALQRFTGTDASSASQTADEANWEDVDDSEPVRVAADATAVYRFVNRDAPSFALPLTGGAGSGPYWIGGAVVVLIGLVIAIVVGRRRSARRN